MEVWIDAQLPPALAQWLRVERAVEALHVEALGLHEARDLEIFEAARATEAVVVVLTKDADFPRLLRERGPPPQVVWLRCGNASNPDLRRILSESWPRTAELLTSGEALVEIRRRDDLRDARATSG